MPDVHAVSSADAFRASLRRSRARRASAARSRRLRARSRGGMAVMAAAMTVFGGAATAATGGARAESPQRATASAPSSTVVKRGATGPLVAALQRRLGLRADGAFGPRTERAVKRFQRRRGLTPDGVVGPATAGKLDLRVAREATVVSPLLTSIAQCESGGNPAAVSAGGTYRGKYQFSRETWAALGGVGDPAAAPEAEQDRLAAKLLASSGTSPWPNCA